MSPSNHSQPATGQSDQIGRMRRELRAMAAVNRHLQGQLDGSTSDRRRREGQAGRWLTELADQGGATEPVLVEHPAGVFHVLEGGLSRRVKAGLLVPAIEAHLGPRRPPTAGELADWTEGLAVEVLEGPQGAPFLVLGHTRLPLRGLPVPYPVKADSVAKFPLGPELNVTAALGADRGGSSLKRRVGQVEIGGITVAAGARKVKRRLKRLVPSGS